MKQLITSLISSTKYSIAKNSMMHGNSHKFSSIQLSSDISQIFPSIDSNALDTLKESINAWSVNGQTLNSPDLASNFFAFSLFPYLMFLYFLSRPQTKTPPISDFGFKFLLVFVFATIPAGIYAKYQYHDILANVDYLHFAAESLLTVTNLLIITGFRNSIPINEINKQTNKDSFIRDCVIVITLLLGSYILNGVSPHIEPSNALSLPTWVVHTSSLIEWLVAMDLIWKYADISKNMKWKGLTWGMLPAHTSGVCACTFHFFYNSPMIYWLVTLQAAFTVIGNCSLAFAAYRIFNSANNDIDTTPTIDSNTVTTNNDELSLSLGSSSVSESAEKRRGSDLSFWGATALKSVLFAVLVKYGELYIDSPFSPTVEVAAAILLGSTVIVASHVSRLGSEAAPQFS